MNDAQRRTHDQPLFDGRLEKRFTMSVAVRVARAIDPRDVERTVTDNVSPHGACIVSERSWQLGEAVIVSPRGEFQRTGKVVYSVAKTGDRFCLGVEFTDCSVKWGA